MSIALPGTDLTPPVSALADSGCEHVLAAPWLASAAGVDPRSSDRTINLGLGGSTVKVRFVDLTLRLYAPDAPEDDLFVDWHAEAGFLDQWRPTWPMIVGQVGFMDQFTVTMSRLATTIAIEDCEQFDERFGVPLTR